MYYFNINWLKRAKKHFWPISNHNLNRECREWCLSVLRSSYLKMWWQSQRTGRCSGSVITHTPNSDRLAVYISTHRWSKTSIKSWALAVYPTVRHFALSMSGFMHEGGHCDQSWDRKKGTIGHKWRISRAHNKRNKWENKDSSWVYTSHFYAHYQFARINTCKETENLIYPPSLAA